MGATLPGHWLCPRCGGFVKIGYPQCLTCGQQKKEV